MSTMFSITDCNQWTYSLSVMQSVWGPDRIAVCTRDSAGVPTLLALPSDRPSLRQEAVSVELLLSDAIAQPPSSLDLYVL